MNSIVKKIWKKSNQVYRRFFLYFVVQIQLSMIIRTISLCLLILSIFSCEPEGRIYSKNKELSPNIEWFRADSREFKVKIDDASKDYDIGLTFRFATGFQFATADVVVTEISPSGNQLVTEHSLKVREKNGDYIGEPGMDIWDSEHIIQSTKKYTEEGTYTYIIKHNMINDPMNYAMEIGLFVDESK